MGKQTSLYNAHVEAGAKIVDFAGWDMPLHYGSQLEEHHQVRRDAGMFDVSHMTMVDVTGPDVAKFLRYLLANNIDRLIPGKALYTCMLNEEGGVIDDLIVYKVSDDHYRLVVNSGTHDKDLLWLDTKAQDFNLKITEQTNTAMIAIQGPNAHNKITAAFAREDLPVKPFTFSTMNEWFIARTGYTGEDGFEIIMPAALGPVLWQKLLKAGIKPCGLGARDTLRLEAGFNLYGADMDETVSPLESNLTWTVAFEPPERDFIGRTALQVQLNQGLQKKMVGLVLEGQGVLRNHQKVMVNGVAVGEITSGSFSPTLGRGIALARIQTYVDNECSVEIRGKLIPAHIIKPPFVRQGKKAFLEISQSNGAVP